MRAGGGGGGAERVISNPPGQMPAKTENKLAVWKTLSLSSELNDALYECEEDFRGSSGREGQLEGEDGSSAVMDAPIHTLDQFYQWFAAVEAEAGEQGRRGLEANLERLLRVQRQAEAVLLLVQAGLAACESSQSALQAVAGQARGVRDSTRAVEEERARCTALAAALHHQLRSFRALDAAAAKLESGAQRGDEAAIRAALLEAEECGRWARTVPHYAEAQKQARRLAALQHRALQLLGDALCAAFAREEASAIAARSAADSAAYIAYRAAAGQLRPRCAELEQRAADAKAAAVLRQCQERYCASRVRLCGPGVKTHLSVIVQIPDLARCAAEGASYLQSVAHLEYQLYHCFFDRDCPPMAQLVADFAAMWYEELRPYVLHAKSFAVLCGVLLALRSRISAAASSPGTAGNSSLTTYFQKMVADAQERLIFLVQFFVREDIAGFVPDAARDLNFPARLIQARREDDPQKTDWYCPVERSVVALRRLRAVLEDNVFDGVAQEILLATVLAIVSASHTVTQKSSVVDGHLFVLKHVCLLRDEVKELRVSKGLVERSIDFSKMRAALAKRDISLKLFLPDLQTQSFDARKDLEMLLVHTLDAFVGAALNPALQPLTGLVARCAAHTSGGSAAGASLKDEAWFNVAKVLTVLTEACAALSLRLPESLAICKQYLPLAHRRAVFVSIQNACLEPLVKLRKMLDGAFPDLAVDDPMVIQMDSIRKLVERTCAEML